MTGVAPERAAQVMLDHLLACAECWSWLSARLVDIEVPGGRPTPRHATEEWLRRWHEDLLDVADNAWTAAHLSECETCRRLDSQVCAGLSRQENEVGKALGTGVERFLPEVRRRLLQIAREREAGSRGSLQTYAMLARRAPAQHRAELSRLLDRVWRCSQADDLHCVRTVADSLAAEATGDGAA
jgi:hypothetical protein